ncbi:hypothetical protein M501DRAFT_987049 [Patellaria atrata CBS 101060]|uniref:Velvet domain-containing protein n=1 Tax=Patellaria atrata CBS 101060 TaxID=1346257 RepID=A0A9P4VQR4_9PEZI|nr:hypothetical protein M501DRAFT_987049 [Patellaria atrata CBS 101060]
MAETQHAPRPQLFTAHRRLPQQGYRLPPLTIPALTQSENQYGQPAGQTLPGIHSAPPARPLPRQQLPHAAPVEKLLGTNPYTPPRSESALSPQQFAHPQSPRSAIEWQPQRRGERHPFEEPRPPPNQESAFLSPIEGQRKLSYAPLPSPNYTPNFPGSNAPYRGSSSIQREPAIPPYAPPPPSYRDPAPIAPPRAAPQQPQQRHSTESEPYLYRLTVRQQPIAARACGFGERDRRVIDPPPIIQLTVTDKKTGVPDTDELRYSLNVIHCTLWNEHGTHEETALMQPDRRTTRRLMGQLVASPSVAKDEHDVEGCFFCFPDLSCRTHGRYRLRFVMIRIDPSNLIVGDVSPILADVMSDVFTVYTAKDFPGMRPSSALTRALKLQGCNIQVKKGNEKSLAARKRAKSPEEAEGEEDDTDPNKAKRRR